MLTTFIIIDKIIFESNFKRWRPKKKLGGNKEVVLYGLNYWALRGAANTDVNICFVYYIVILCLLGMGFILCTLQFPGN